MGIRSIKVRQPQFGEWVIHHRQELGLSAFDLKERLNGRLSERTLKYLEDCKREAFSEETIKILAEGLEITYLDFLKIIDNLGPQGFDKIKLRPARFFFDLKHILILTVTSLVVLTLFLIALKWIFNNFSGAEHDNFHFSDSTINTLISEDHPNIIFAEDRQGRLLWQKRLDTKIVKIEQLDIDKDGKEEIIAGTHKSSYSDWGAHPGWLYIWDKDGNQTTAYNLWKPSIYPADEFQATLSDFQILDLNDDDTLEIIASIHGVEWYPSQIIVLHFYNDNFREIASYWHPGYISNFYINDLNHDGKMEIFGSAVNNDLKRVPSFEVNQNIRSFFMLTADSIFGQAPPYLGLAGYGGQKWYYYITAPDTQGSSVKGFSLTGENQNYLLVALSNSCFFTLNYNGELISHFEGESCRGLTHLHRVSNTPDW